MDTWDISTADEDWLIDLCHKAADEGQRIRGQEHGGPKVVQISDDIVVKCGDIRRSEVAAQEVAYHHADRSIVHIPKIYRFIESAKSGHSQGYLFMEYVQGQTLEDVNIEDHKDIPSRIANILAPLRQIPIESQIPGPLGGGEAHGYIFGDEGASTGFASIEDINVQQDQRRFDPIDLTPYRLVLCHGDICRRHMSEKHHPGTRRVSLLVDWGFAGLYPRIFELAAISYVVQNDATFKNPIIDVCTTSSSLSDQEKQDIDRLRAVVRSANLRWSFREPRTTVEEDNFIQEHYESQKKMKEEQEAAGIPCLITDEFLEGLLAQKSHPGAVKPTTTESVSSPIERS